MVVANLQIGEVARQVGISLRTVRFYEEQGLVKPSAVSSAGLRLYCLRDVGRLRFIRRLRLLGLSIDDIKLALGIDSQDPASKTEILQRSLQAMEMAASRFREQVKLLRTLQKQNDASIESLKACLECTKDCTDCPQIVNVL